MLSDIAKIKIPKITKVSRKDGNQFDFHSWSKLISDASIGRRPSLLITINATHSGTIVNNRVYPGVQMEKSLSSWVAPYGRPVLSKHPSSSLLGTDEPRIFGRVKKAEYVRLAKSDYDFANDWKHPSIEDVGSGFIRLYTEITDEEAIDGILAGRLLTVSTGQYTDKMLCSHCGRNKLSEDRCEHEFGQAYVVSSDSKRRGGEKYLCYGITGKLAYDHVAFVNTPAQPFAAVVNVDKDKSHQYHHDMSSCFTVEDLMLTDEHGSISFTLTHEGERPVVPDARRAMAVIQKVDDEQELDMEPRSKRPGPSEGIVTSVVTADQLSTPTRIKESKMTTVNREAVAESVILKSIVDSGLEFDWELYKQTTGRDKLFASAYDSEIPEDMKGFEDAEFKGPNRTIPVRGVVMAKAARRLLPYLRIKDKSSVDAAIEDAISPKSPIEDCGCSDSNDKAANTEIERLRAENNRLLEENKSLRSQVRTSLVDRIMELRISMGKPDLVGLSKEAIDAYRGVLMGRSIESLKDSLSDLQVEKAHTVAKREKPEIQNPTSPASSVEGGRKESVEPVFRQLDSNPLTKAFLLGKA